MSHSKTNSVKEEKERPDLFRAEVISANKGQWLGSILLETRLSPLPILAFVALILALAILLVLFSNYSRKTTVAGLLVPDMGLVRVFAPFSGTVSLLNIREGQHVNKGDALLTVSAQVTTDDGTKLGDTILQSLRAQYRLELQEKRLLKELEKKQLASARTRLEHLMLQKVAMIQEYDLIEQQIATSRRLLNSKRQNVKNKLIPRVVVETAENELLSNLTALEQHRQSSSILNREIDLVRSTLLELPIQNKAELTAINKRLLAIQQRLAENKAKNSIVITAPNSGIVSSLQLGISSFVPVNIPLLTIIPENSRLEAHLYGKSSSVGLLQGGEAVSIRYAAFPYQRFGLFRGKVLLVSRSALEAAELPAHVAAFSGKSPNESWYKIVVELENDSINHNSREIALQPGLRLQADILLESMRLYKWFLKPLLSSPSNVSA